MAGNWNDFSVGVVSFGGVWVFGCQISSSLRVGNWLLQHSANSVLDCEYTLSTWAKEASYICLDMSENTCGVAVDATFPQVALDMSEDEATSPLYLQSHLFGVCTARGALESSFFSGRRLHELSLYSAPCMVRQWIHALASVYGVYAEFDVFLREGVLEVDSCPALRRE